MIAVRELVKNHGPLRVLDGVSLTVERGQVAAVIGPSGGGKSTLLRCINGLEAFQAGEVRVGDVALHPDDVRKVSGATLLALRRRVGMVFQQFNLFPHLSVLENVTIGPRLSHKVRLIAVALSGDGKTALTGGEDNTARLWETTTGKPMESATMRASSREVAVPLAGCVMSRLDSSAANRLRSSARSIESGEVPRMRTPAFCSARDSLSGVCPPNCTRHATSPPADASVSITAITSSKVSGWK